MARASILRTALSIHSNCRLASVCWRARRRYTLRTAAWSLPSRAPQLAFHILQLHGQVVVPFQLAFQLSNTRSGREESVARFAEPALSADAPAASSISGNSAGRLPPASSAICPWLKIRTGKRVGVTDWEGDVTQSPFGVWSSTFKTLPPRRHVTRCLIPSRSAVHRMLVSSSRHRRQGGFLPPC